VRKHSSYPFPEAPATYSKILESRRTFLSGQLNEVCRENDRPRVLSVANGALREAETAIELCRENGGTFVVVDGAGEPPDIFRQDYDNPFLRYISYPYGAIPSKENIGEFDYVYSLNLFSELNQERARKTLVSLISLVRPGGRLLISNFAAEFGEAAWASSQEACGPVYRREEDLAELVPDSREHQILGHAVWRDASRAILYLEIQKSGVPNELRRRGPAWSSSSQKPTGLRCRRR
jgi:SAM-dependent methyltransferase